MLLYRSTSFSGLASLNKSIQEISSLNEVRSKDLSFRKLMCFTVGDGLGTPEPAIRSGDTGQRIPCSDSCQLITALMCNQWAPKVARKCESKHWYACGADGLSGGRSVYSHMITKFSRMSSLPYFLTHGAPLRALRAREFLYYCDSYSGRKVWSSEPMLQHFWQRT